MKEIGKRVRRIYKLSNKSLGERSKNSIIANSNIIIPVYFILISRRGALSILCAFFLFIVFVIIIDFFQ